MTDIIYIDELKDAHDEVRRTSWILDDKTESYFCDRYAEEYHEAQGEYDRLMEAYAAQEGVKDVQALKKAFDAYAIRQRKINETHERWSDENLQKFYNDVGRLSEDDE